MTRKYKEIYDNKFLESIPEKYREAFGNLDYFSLNYRLGPYRHWISCVDCSP